MTPLTDDVIAGNRRAIARMLTHVENNDDVVEEALADLFTHTGDACVVGVTGAPGTGKSSLVNAMAKAYRKQDKTVGIIAVDPTSPFSGGAILGDRIRMRDLAGDKGVFIRSMATRGSLGGLSRAVRDGIRVLDAAGFDIILVETVGAGQSEVDIVRTAQTTLVVDAPGLGDDVQAIKAGILEIADVLVVNKADRPGASNTVRSLKTMLDLGHPASSGQVVAHHGRMLPVDPVTATVKDDTPFWIPPIVETIATGGTSESNITALLDAIDSHRRFLVDNVLFERLERQRVQIELYDLLQDALVTRLLDSLPVSQIETLVQHVSERRINPREAIRQILETHRT